MLGKSNYFAFKLLNPFKMKQQSLALAIAIIAFSSCSTIYRNSQTPDDVYFSPAPIQEEYVRVESGKEKYNYSDSYYDDRYLKMKVTDRNRWNDLDDWFAFDRYSYRYNYYYGTYYNPYTTWNYYHNPYFHNTIIVVHPQQSTKTVNIVKPRPFSITAYSNSNYNNINSKGKFSNTVNVIRAAYNNSNNNYSNRQNNNSNYSPVYSQPVRTYSPPPSSNSGSSSGSSSSSSGEVSRPTRGGN